MEMGEIQYALLEELSLESERRRRRRGRDRYVYETGTETGRMETGDSCDCGVRDVMSERASERERWTAGTECIYVRIEVRE